MQVTLLGTAAARPMPGRNVSAILVEQDATAVLLDCGEGTERQRLRYASHATVAGILVSHMHADHYLGVPGLVSARASASETAPTSVWVPAGGESEMEAALDLAGLADSERPVVRMARPGDTLASGGLLVRPFRTRHRAGSVGYVVESRAGEASATVVYTGDTRPSGATVHAARGADLLIHEATFCDDDRARARSTAHSTAAEAARIAAEAGVRRLVLTHLSARYAEDPRTPALEARAIFPQSVAGRDGMVFKLPFEEPYRER